VKRVNGFEAPLESLDPPDALLELLRDRLGRPELAWAEPPRPLSGLLAGNSANEATRLVLRDPPAGWQGPFVLRVHRGEFAQSRCRVEALVQEALSAAGYPVPRVRMFADDDGRVGAPFLVMDLLPGWNGMEALAAIVPVGALLGALVSRPVTFGGLALAAFGALSALLTRRLHRLPVAPIARAIEKADEHVRLDPVAFWLEQIRAGVESGATPELEPALRWLERHRPTAAATDVVCHGDFHPGNIVMSPRSVGVIDWEGVAIAPPEYDVAITQVRLIGQSDPVGLPPGVQQVASAAIWLVARALWWSYRLADGYAGAPLAAAGARRMRRWLARLIGAGVEPPAG
jgi:aminoglycoside phosphotransferase (APT) family kinase protein